MPSGSKKLIEDYEQVRKLLETYPNIKIINTVGNPPEQYDIQYSIKGYRTNPDGTAAPENKHEVRINLPFGYPHFPPTAKPITPIFHPDIDPDAIRIADFWQDNHSLPELIVHIGQMICGNHYTREEPFNQSAFEWFEERKSWLPFDILEPRDEEEAAAEIETEPASAVPSAADKKKKIVPAKDLDILKDDIDFPFDEEEDLETAEDEFSFETGEEDIEPADEITFDLGEETGPEDLFSLEQDEQTDEFSFDALEEELAEPLSPKKSAEKVSEDLFSLEVTDESDEFSLDLDALQKEEESSATGLEAMDLFELEAEAPAGKSEDGAPLEFDSGDIEAAFIEEEAVAAPDESEESIISLDDLSGLEKEEEPLDFGIADEPFDLNEDSTADLSGLEEELTEEIAEETDFAEETGEGDVDKILSALSLDQDFSSPGKAGEHAAAIRALIEQKQIFSAKKVLADLPDPDALADKKELELTIADAVGEAEDLYKKADKHEKKGEFEKAGILLDLVANIATDFPGLEMARNRIRESMMSGGKKKPSAEDEEKQPDQFIGEEKAVPKKPDKKKAGAKIRIRIPARLVAVVLIVIVLGGIGAGVAFVYKNDSERVEFAQIAVQKAEQLVSRKEFKDAQKEFDGAGGALNKVLFFQGQQKESLTNRIASVVNSSLFKEGLQGRVLYGDQFVSVETAKAIDKLNTQKEYADQVLKAGKIDQAIAAYEKSLPYAEAAGFEEEVATIGQKIGQLRLELALSQAKQFEDKQDWQNAIGAYQEAAELSKSISSPEEQKDISIRLATASYSYEMNEGLKAINDSQWQRAIDSFQNIKKVLQTNPTVASEKEQVEVDKLLVQSQLYLELGEARKKYENKEWEKAIDTYNKAISLVKTNSGLLGQDAAENIQKIEKTILTTRVAREQNGITEAKAGNDLEKAVQHYQQIVTLLSGNSSKDDETLAKILEDAQTRTTEIKNQLLIGKRETWLTENYEKIFRDNYPSAKLSDLLNPKVRFVKRDGNILIFNMSCTERKQGSTFRLELYYQNDLDKDAWSLYSGKIDENGPGGQMQ